jgi:predicted enzyme related to lactoylglutathione lyase
MFLGLRTVGYATPDLQRGKEWYTLVLGQPPYFDEPFYVGFQVGGFELGLIPDAKPGQGGVTAYWGVPQIDSALKKLVDHGAQIHEEIQDVGGGIKVASVLDPFGNIIGIIENPVFDPSQVR